MRVFFPRFALRLFFPLLGFWLGVQEGFAQCSSGYVNVQGRVVDTNGSPVHRCASVFAVSVPGAANHEDISRRVIAEALLK